MDETVGQFDDVRISPEAPPAPRARDGASNELPLEGVETGSHGMSDEQPVVLLEEAAGLFDCLQRSEHVAALRSGEHDVEGDDPQFVRALVEPGGDLCSIEVRITRERLHPPGDLIEQGGPLIPGGLCGADVTVETVETGQLLERCGLLVERSAIVARCAERLALGQLDSPRHNLADAELGPEQLERLELHSWAEPPDEDEDEPHRQQEETGGAVVRGEQRDGTGDRRRDATNGDQAPKPSTSSQCGHFPAR